MAWTTPMTAVDGSPFTAAQFNRHIRDNLLEMAPARITAASNYIAQIGTHQVVERSIVASFTDNIETTTSTDWANLPTFGPSVTVETGTAAIVIVCGRPRVSTGGRASMGYETTGSTAYDPALNRSVQCRGNSDNWGIMGSTWIFHGVGAGLALTPGINTFTMKYQVSSGTGTFSARRIIVIPF